MLNSLSAGPCLGLLLGLYLVLPARAGEPAEVTYDKKALQEWVRTLKSVSPEDRGKAADAIREIAKQSQAAVRTIFDAGVEGESGHESPMFRLLVDLGPTAVPVLKQALWDERIFARAVAIRLLGDIGSDARSATPALRLALKDPHPVIRAWAAQALAGVGARSALPDILKLLAETEAETRLTAAAAAINLGAEAKTVIPALVELIAEDETLLKAADTLALLGPEARPAVPDLVRRLTSLPSLRQGPVIRVLAGIGPEAKEALPALAKLLEGKPEDVQVVRLNVAEALWSIGRDARAATILKEYLADPKSRNPAAAAELLGWIEGPKDVVPALVKRLKDDALADRQGEMAEIAYLCAKIGPPAKEAVPALSELLSSKSPATRIAAAEALGRIGSLAKSALPALVKIHREDSEPLAKVTAACAAARIQPDEEATLRLADVLKAGTDEIKVLAANRLGFLGATAKPAVAALQTARKEGSDKVKHAAALALWQIVRDAESLPTLIALLRSNDALLRQSVAADVGFDFREEGKPAVPGLAKMLFDPDSDLRSGAAEALSRIGPAAADAVPALKVILLSDEHDGLHSAACEALGLIGPAARDAQSVLKQSLGHPSRHVRLHAALALWHVAEDRSGESILAQCLRSRDYRERIVAAEALWRMSKNPAALQQLLRTLRGPDPRDKERQSNELFMTVRALGRIGPPAEDAIADLIRLKDHDDPAMVRSAAEALRAISPAGNR